MSAGQAKDAACRATTEINGQIEKLKGLEPTSSAVPAAQAALTKIGDDLSTIGAAAPNVGGQLKSELQRANAAFGAQVQQVGQSVTSAQSLSDAATALTKAGDRLAADYQKAFANVRC